MNANGFEQMSSIGSFPYFSFIIATLLVVSIILFTIPKMAQFAKHIALVTNIVILAELILFSTYFDFTKPGQFQLSEFAQWIPQLGVTWALGVNAFSLILIIGSVILTSLALIAGWKDNEYALGTMSTLKSDIYKEGALENKYLSSIKSEKNYIALVLLLEAFVILVFTARDLFLFYLAFEAMLVPAYFMISKFGIGHNKAKAGIKFILYSLFGGLVMLIGIITIYVYNPPSVELYNMDLLVQLINMPFEVEIAVFITFFIAFAIKAPMVPLHTWLTTTVENARPATSILLVGILDKIGTFGMLHFTLVLFPNATKFFAPYILVWALISVFYAGLLAVWEKNILRLVALTSVSHFGFIVLGIYVGSDIALTGAMLYMVAHMISIAGLFSVVGYLGKRVESFNISAISGMQKQTPVLAGVFLISGLATIALPGLSGFVPEYLIFLGTFKTASTIAIIGVLAVVVSAVYILLPYQKIFAGQVKEEHTSVQDLNIREKFVSAVLVVLMFVLGLFPNILLNSFSKISENYVDNVFALDRNSDENHNAVKMNFIEKDLYIKENNSLGKNTEENISKKLYQNANVIGGKK